MVEKVPAANGTFMLYMSADSGTGSAYDTYEHYLEEGIDIGYYIPEDADGPMFPGGPLGAVINLRTAEVTGVWIGASNGDLLDAWDKILALVEEANNG